MTKPVTIILLTMSVLGHWNAYAAQRSPGWSFWGTAEGMKESYTSSVAVHDGNVWIKHGSVTGMNVLNGYGLGELSDPGDVGKIQASPDGTLWSWTGQHLSRYHQSQWKSFNIEAVTRAGFLRSDSEQFWTFTSKAVPSLRSRIWVVGLDVNHALILLPDQILEFEAIGKTSRVVLSATETGLGRFTSMRQVSRDIWITGAGGVGRLSTPGFMWQEAAKPTGGYTEIAEPFEGDDGEVFVTAFDNSGRAVVLRLHGMHWEFIYQGESRNLRGWRGAEKTVWIQDGNRLLHLIGGKAIPVERAGPLSGVVLSITPERTDRFWVGTTQGLAKYTPPLWRTPPETAGIDDVVNSITEDRQQRVWFLSSHLLICLDGEKWQVFPLPKGETAWNFTPEGLATLPDGTIAIRTASTELLTFDPRQKRFRSIQHPGGRDIRLFFQRPNGQLLVQTVSRTSSNDFALETFDGQQFQPFLNPGSAWDIVDLRCLVTGEQGEIWVGASAKFGVYRNQLFTRVAASSGFTDSGAFSLVATGGGKLLAGGRDGLFEYNGTNWHPVLRGLDRVRNITVGSNGSLWIASGTGVHKLHQEQQISYGTEEGLPSDIAYRVFVDSRGRVWAGTSRGLSLFHPDADLQAPRTEISAEQNAREAPPGGRVRMVFSGIDKWKATSLDRLMFSWRIDGSAWSSFTSQTSVSLDKLLPGDHTFGVRAMDRSGNIDPNPPNYDFTVLPSWYQTSGFQFVAGASVLVTGLLLALAVFNYRQLGRRKRLEHDRQEILEMVARREPLASILQRIVWAVAANQKGAIGAALQYSDSVLQFLAFSSHSLRLSHTSGHWTDVRDDGQKDLSFWGLEHGPTVQIYSGQQEVLGALVAILPRHAVKTKVDIGMLQALSGIASVAIENARLYDQLAHRANHDLLTGLPNRLLIESELKIAMDEAREHGESVALLFMDLDRFKHVNDSLGHSVGDSLLGQVAARLTQAIPEDAIAARIGGDEFMVVLKRQRDNSVAERVARRILESLRKPLGIGGHEIYTSASIGISMFPQDGADPFTLQRQADLAMYRAKSRGKSRYEFFSHEIDDLAGKSMAMEQVLRKALEEDWLELFYQGQFNRAGELVGLEALIRLNHPLFGLIGPCDFIALAEETGLIHDLGEWVLRQVCRQIRRWQADGLRPVKVAINVSPLQFRQPSFAELVGAILDQMEIDPRLIELELTESMIMDDYEEASRHMQKLRSLGASIAVDDFGTGYCSLLHLQRLPIDVLKIDRSFVQEIDSSTSTWSLVKAIVGLAHTLNLSVVAEGVENECQRLALIDLECDRLQGFALHAPQSAAVISPSLFASVPLRNHRTSQDPRSPAMGRPYEQNVFSFWPHGSHKN